MKNLFAQASYSFNNFYNNLNAQGQLVFSVIMTLIILLCIVLFIAYVIQSVQTKIKLHNIKKETKKINVEESKNVVSNAKKDEEAKYINEKTEIEDIASAIKEALKEEDAPITLTNFEEDQEKTAIISIDELMQKAKELELIDDDEKTGVNYLEKYNLEPSEVEEVVNNTISNEEDSAKEVKAFKVSQVISPIYGVRKEVVEEEE